MSILIKGMEMPKDGSWRSIRIYPDGTIGRPIGFGDYALVEGAKAIPAADVRPVVMCRDCKWTKKDDMDDPAIYCRKWDRWEMPPDGFCWLGRKKEES